MADDDKISSEVSSKLTPASDVADDSADTPDEPTVSRVPQKIVRAGSPLTPIALVIALIATGLAVWALLSMPDESSAAQGMPAGDAASGASASGDPKQRLCDAAQVVAVAVQMQTNANLGPEPAAVEAVAANARLAMLGGGEYLLTELGPDTPPEMVDTARSFANSLRAIGINALAGVPNAEPAQADRIKAWEESRKKLGEMCTQ